MTAPPAGLDAPLGVDTAASGRWLAAITVLGALLRLHGLDSDLWFDEIITVIDVRHHSLLALLTTFESANRHLLNSLAIALTLALGGEANWAIRLPAALCGIALAPAGYFFSRSALGRRESLLVALLFATSYHLVFFSQNARGYSGLLLGSLLAMGAFARAVVSGERRWWSLYLTAALFAFASNPLAAFLVTAHLLVLGARSRARGLPRRRVAEGAGVLAAALALGTLLYAPAIRHSIAYASQVYQGRSFGQRFFSGGNLGEWELALTGGRAGPGVLIAIVLALAVALVLWSFYLRRQPWTSWLVVSPLVLQVAVVAAAALRTAPRFFLWAVPALLFHAVAFAAAVEARAADRRRGRLTAGVTLLLVALSATLLVPYYDTPKQPTRSSLAWLAARLEPGDVVVAVDLAWAGARYYGPALGLEEGRNLFVVRDLAAFAEVERRFDRRHLRLVTTLEDFTRAEHPDLGRAVDENYPVEKRFPGLLSGGNVELRRQRAPETVPGSPG